jgi:type IV pilus assembly protein PilV
MKQRHAFGYSLMEVLVALLVLSAGMIGAAALQLSAWQMAQQSAFHTAAHQLAAEVAEWLQVHHKNLPDGLQNLEINSASTTTQEARHCYGLSCTSEQFIAFMVRDWQARLQTALPDARLRICRDGASWDGDAPAYRWSCTVADGETPLVIKIGWKNTQTRKEPDAPLVVLSAGA